MAVTQTIQYAAKYSSLVDEKFKVESKSDQCINQDYDFVGAQTVKVYNIPTAPMGTYKRSGTNRYGAPEELSTTTQELTMSQDRAFTFTIDKMNEDETAGALNAGQALSRQLREVVIPEVDTYRFAKMSEKAGNIVTATADITNNNIEELIVKATEVLDEAEVPMEERFMVVTPAIYKLIKQAPKILLDTDIAQEMKLTGVVSQYDGVNIIKVPSNRLPDKVAFLMGHPLTTCAPVKLAEYKVHDNAPGISGALVEGRVYYDAFVLNNKNKGLYVQKMK